MVLNIGKQGVTDAFIDEVRKTLIVSKTIKVRILRSARSSREKKDMAEEVAGKVKANLVDVRGYTFRLERKF